MCHGVTGGQHGLWRNRRVRISDVVEDACRLIQIEDVIQKCRLGDRMLCSGDASAGVRSKVSLSVAR